jgi:hypothetical protein
VPVSLSHAALCPPRAWMVGRGEHTCPRPTPTAGGGHWTGQRFPWVCPLQTWGPSLRPPAQAPSSPSPPELLLPGGKGFGTLPEDLFRWWEGVPSLPTAGGSETAPRAFGEWGLWSWAVGSPWPPVHTGSWAARREFPRPSVQSMLSGSSGDLPRGLSQPGVREEVRAPVTHIVEAFEPRSVGLFSSSSDLPASRSRSKVEKGHWVPGPHRVGRSWVGGAAEDGRGRGT